MPHLKFAIRLFRRNLALTASAILATALGIGASTAMFSAVDGILLRPLPFPRPERVVNVWESMPARNIPMLVVASGNYIDWRSQNRTLAAIGAWQQAAFNLASRDSEPERYLGAVCDPGFFATLGIEPALGRVFTNDETEPGHDAVVVLSWTFWQQRFGGDRQVLGRELELDSRPRVIIGVMPPGFDYPLQAAMWAPLAPSPAARARRDLHTLRVIARLKDGVPLEQARAEFHTIAEQLASQYPDIDGGATTVVTPMLDDLVGSIRPALIVLLGSVAALLLLACGNVSNLLLVKAAARRREIAIRGSLGASGAAIFGQMLTESLLLAGIGGAAGLLLAYAALRGLLPIAPSNIPRLDQIALNWRVAAVAIACSAGAGILFGLAPAWYCRRVDLAAMLKDGGRGVSSHSRIRSALAIAQVAIALVLLAGAGLLTRSFLELLRVDPGFRADHVMTMRLVPARTKYLGKSGLQVQLARGILQKTAAIPGVRAAAIATDVPLLPNPSFIMRFEGRPPVTPSQAPIAAYSAVTPGFFDTMGMRLVRGRTFTDGDSETAPLVVIVNETLVHRYFPHEDPIGKRLEIGFADPPRWREIVGVVADVRSAGLDQETPVQVYAAYNQSPSFPTGVVSAITVLARSQGDPALIAAPMRSAILSVDLSQPVFAVQPMTEVVSRSVAQRRLSLLLLGFFASAALLLAAIGVYGVMAFSVSQRTNEIGIRMTLGARPLQVAWEVQRRAMALVIAGLVLGFIAAWPLMQFLGSLLFRVSPHDPAALAVPAAILAAVSLAACYLPSRRAARVDPAIALRDD